MLFAPMVGAVAGLVAGWYMATDAVEDSSLSGMILWAILVAASVIPMWVVEGDSEAHHTLAHAIRRFHAPDGGQPAGSLASAVWLASSQE